MNYSRPYPIVLLAAALGLPCGCGPEPPATIGPADASSDPDQVRAADFSILYLGNSHTASHNLPGLIADMIRFRHPDKKVFAQPVAAADKR